MAEPTRPDADTGDDATPDLKATYPDMEHARKAVKGLERRGVEGANITLLGEADAVSHRTDNMGRDERMLSYAWRSAVSGFVIGSAVGAGLGLLMGVIVFGWLSGGMWGTISGGVLVGGGLGVLLGAIVRLPQSDAGLAAVENEVDGPVELGVHTLGADEHATAQEALAAQEPAEIATVEGDVRGAHHGSEEPEASMSPPPTRQEPRPTP
ncbi:MAG: hypothetical protein M3425_07920, partial [Actinomycetota bacterium]|nr:hypothetical protein [Actinomycetota bacterium]